MTTNTRQEDLFYLENEIQRLSTNYHVYGQVAKIQGNELTKQAFLEDQEEQWKQLEPLLIKYAKERLKWGLMAIRI